MSTNLDRWMSELSRINNAKHDIANIIRSKGIDLSASVKFNEYPGIISNIEPYDINYTLRSFNETNLVAYAYSPIGDCSSALANCKDKIVKISIGENITNISNSFRECANLCTTAICGNKITDMSYAYCNCTNLIGSPACGPNVTSMYSTYYECHNITGSPVCGPNVTSMYSTYYECRNITGSPVCGPNVINMSWAYDNCTNLTGSPVCGPNVTNMCGAYSNCSNITGDFICGNNVGIMDYCFSYTDVYGNHYYNNSTKLTSVEGLYVRNFSSLTPNRLNIFTNPVIQNLFLDENYYGSITGDYVSWSETTSETIPQNYNYCYFNSYYNIYIYTQDYWESSGGFCDFDFEDDI